jgi:hypothetical protein
LIARLALPWPFAAHLEVVAREVPMPLVV